MFRRVLTGSVAAAIVALAGCGDRGPPTAEVAGKVTYKGEPVAKGEIRFIPAPGTAGPVTGARIVAGAYAARGASAVPIGKHRVEITAQRDLPARKDVPFTPEQQYLPAKYNTESKLELTVPAGSRMQTHDFALAE